MKNPLDDFHPVNSFRALLDHIYDAKFSKLTVLSVVLLSMIYTVYRTQHYLIVEFRIDRKSTRLNSSHIQKSRMPSSA